jgi:hypothetical protein
LLDIGGNVIIGKRYRGDITFSEFGNRASKNKNIIFYAAILNLSNSFFNNESSIEYFCGFVLSLELS